MKNILVTGASGFIGQHLVKLLCSQGKNVRVLVRKSSNLDSLADHSIERVFGDVCERNSLQNALAGVTSVYHLAGLTRENKLGDFQRVNVEGTENLLQAALEQANPPRFVYVSSLAAGGPGRKNVPKSESDLSCPISAYGKSKLEAEKRLIAASDRISVSIIRPPIVFGEGDWASVELFRVVKKSRLHLVPGWCDPRFSFIHAADLSRFLVLVEEKGERLAPESETDGRGIYYVDTGEHVPYSEFGRMIGAALNLPKTKILHCPPIAVLTVGWFGEIGKKILGKTVPFDWNKARESLSGPWICSSEKGRKQLDFAPEKPLQERLNETAKWYLENGWL